MRSVVFVFVLSFVSLTLLVAGCPDPVGSDDFVRISKSGFNQEDHARDLNEYPWSMTYFQPDPEQDGHIYVGTGNSVINFVFIRFGFDLSSGPAFRPPEIRRYRPDLGRDNWETVLDYRAIETGPEWDTTGFRALAVYQPPDAAAPYLYAGTFGNMPALWRSATGAAGTWEKVWDAPLAGSIRALTVHQDKLWIGLDYEVVTPSPPGALYVTDGTNVTLVDDTLFGNPENTGCYSLTSFNGWLYAGTGNRTNGYEVHKLAGPEGQMEPIAIITGGGPARSNQATTQMVEFDDHLYVPALIYAGINTGGGFPVRGADMVRVDREDNVETIVGPESITGVGSGFDDRTNAYLWSMVVHEGKLYCGTWDATSFIPIAKSFLPDIIRGLPGRLRGVTPFDEFTANGAELYCSEDGETWDLIFNDGLGNADNYGIRNMLSLDGALYLGFANVVDGLEVFRSAD